MLTMLTVDQGDSVDNSVSDNGCNSLRPVTVTNASLEEVVCIVDDSLILGKDNFVEPVGSDEPVGISSSRTELPGGDKY